MTSTTVGGSIVITGLSTSPGILASTGGISLVYWDQGVQYGGCIRWHFDWYT
ncbi:MAG: hypothetical protein U0X71_07035 [Sphingobacteriaceae bacterium]